MKKILLSIALSAIVATASPVIDYDKASKAQLIGYIANLEGELSKALTSLDNLITREKAIIESIDAQIATVFDDKIVKKDEKTITVD